MFLHLILSCYFFGLVVIFGLSAIYKFIIEVRACFVFDGACYQFYHELNA